ncbi:translationally-controlled tumor protein [Streptomyces sp. NPDC057245]|uniref:translationally-controlled tumor protein n=1 Tax=Streptomyces sp. NPDC057245 TaxID=3346065 RepID=UPI003645C5CE
MLLYTDIISGDDLFSDAFPIKEIGGAYEVDCHMVGAQADMDVDLGEGGLGGEPDEGVSAVNNVVASHGLQQTSFDRKSYTTYIKRYTQAVEAKLQEGAPERVEGFKAEARVLIKKILRDFENYEFYTGQGMDPDGMVALLTYREDGVTPYFTFFKDGTKVQKL